MFGALDAFVGECYDVVHDQGLENPEGERIAQVGVPTLVLPDDVNWQAVQSDLMYRILSLPNTIQSANKIIDAVADEVATFPDFEDYFIERTLRYGEIGLQASKLAADLRKAHQIPTEQWSAKGALTLAVEQVKADRQEAGNILSWDETEKPIQKVQIAKKAKEG